MPHFYPTRRLPEQPNLEQLRKQAKDLLERYRAGDPATVAEVNRFERAPDPSSFSLNDAQRVLARAYGYQSWPKLKAFVDGANLARLMEAVKTGDVNQARVLLHVRPELAGMDIAGNNEHRALHYAVLRRDVEMVRLLMQSGADARKGIFPHRDATTAFVIARDREYHDVAAVIEEEEQRRRKGQVSPVQDQINHAISTGDNADAIRLIEENDTRSRRLIVKAARHYTSPREEMNLEMIEWLLARRADPQKTDARDLTPLDRAALAADPRNDCAARFPAVAKRLREHGAAVTIRAAVALNDAARVRKLVASNPAVLREIHWMGGGLLSLAANHGHIEMVRLLLDLGADVDERTMLHELEEPTESWGTPLWYAALAGRRDIVELLLDRGADPNANVYASGWALRNAERHPEVKQLLLARGARRQPYMVAEAHDVQEARRLLDASPLDEELARELAWSAADHGCAAIVELALGHLPWVEDDPRWHWILVQPIRGIGGESSDREEYFACMLALLRRGIVNVPNHSGETALHYVAARGGPTEEERVRFAAMLLDHGTRLEARDALLKSTPLGWACRWGRKKLVEFLIARGASVDEKDSEPWATPVAWAAKMGHVEIVAVMSASSRSSRGSAGRSEDPPGSESLGPSR